jgi:hypothetical protein
LGVASLNSWFKNLVENTEVPHGEHGSIMFQR